MCQSKIVKGYRQDLMMNLMLFQAQENIADIYDIDIAFSGKLSNLNINILPVVV